MIWIAILLIAFIAIGLGSRASGRRRHLLVVIMASLTMLAMYETFGSG